METAGTAGQDRLRQSFYFCEPEGRPVALCVEREAMDRMLLEALSGLGRLSRGRGVEVGGILLGRLERDGVRYLVRVEEFQTLPCEHAFGPSFVLSEQDREALRQALDQWHRAPDKRLHALGYWRSHTREGLALRAEDLDVLAAYFPHPSQIALLVQPRGAGPAQAALFCWDGGRIHAEQPDHTFQVDGPIAPARSQHASDSPGVRRTVKPAWRPDAPPDSSPPAANQPALAAATSPRDVPPEPLLPVAEAVSAPERVRSTRAETAEQFKFSMFQSEERPGRRRRIWVSLLVLLLALALGGFLAVDEGLIRLPQPEPERDLFALSLSGQEMGGNLHLTWDRTAPAVRAARRALLIITDGDETRTLELGPEQLRHGSVVYRRITDRVSFRLELSWDNRSLSETWTYAPTGFAR